MTTNIKVVYRSTARRFVVPQTVTWSELEHRLCAKFSLPFSPFKLSYTDEDGDTVTLSTDLELRQVLHDHQKTGNTTLRFTLVTSGDTTEDFNDIASISTATSAESFGDKDPAASVLVEPTFQPTISASGIEVKQRKSSEEKGSSMVVDANDKCSEQEFESSSLIVSDHHDNSIGQLRKMFDQFVTILEKNPHLLEEANSTLDISSFSLHPHQQSIINEQQIVLSSQESENTLESNEKKIDEQELQQSIIFPERQPPSPRESYDTLLGSKKEETIKEKEEEEEEEEEERPLFAQFFPWRQYQQYDNSSEETIEAMQPQRIQFSSIETDNNSSQCEEIYETMQPQEQPEIIMTEPEIQLVPIETEQRLQQEDQEIEPLQAEIEERQDQPEVKFSPAEIEEKLNLLGSMGFSIDDQCLELLEIYNWDVYCVVDVLLNECEEN